MNKIKVNKPFNGKFTMTQPFGVFFWYNGRKLKHQGVDWALPNMTPVVACFDCEVIRVEKFRVNGYGRSIYLRSTNGSYEALYAHLDSTYVEKGQLIKTGERIGASGRTGFCRGKTGYHLHFGLKLYNEYVDPLKFVDVEVPQQELIKTDEYIVQPGDTLFNIASKFYVGGDMWKTLYEENKKVVGSNPDLIRPGMILKIANK